MKCKSNKKGYETRSLAVDALLAAHIQFNHAAGSGPVAVYRCDDCGNYHLTSKGSMDEVLAEHLATGKIQRGQEAYRWSQKLKHR